jgi:hypothetical protein
LNVDGDAHYRRPRFEAGVDVSGTVTDDGETGDRTDRGVIQAGIPAVSRPALVRYRPWRRSRPIRALACSAASSSVVAPACASSTAIRARAAVIGGHRTQSRSVASTRIRRATSKAWRRSSPSYYLYDRPKTTLDLDAPLLSGDHPGRTPATTDRYGGVARTVEGRDRRRHRLRQLRQAGRPGSTIRLNDLGVVFSLGVTFLAPFQQRRRDRDDEAPVLPDRGTAVWLRRRDCERRDQRRGKTAASALRSAAARIATVAGIGWLSTRFLYASGLPQPTPPP